MPGIDNFEAFIVAGILLNLTPGSDTIYILARSIGQGKKAGYYSVFGIVSGAVIHTIFASLGLSAILATSAIAYNVVKWLGVSYLVYLGVKILLDKKSVFNLDTNVYRSQSLKRIYHQGFITNLLNPKVALFYLSFLPQFVSAENTYGALPFLILGLTFMTTGTIWCLFLAYASSFLTQTLRSNSVISKILQKISGFIFICLGVKLVLGER